ncbi:MAG: right-handed parallel beta-helix repeat-containing protein, partial [Candidatus Anstonellales archaeon]
MEISRRIVTYALFLFSLLVSITFSIDVSDCANLNTQGTTYTLISSISTNALSCFNITANSIVLDCQNFSITGTGTAQSLGKAIQTEGYDYLEIKNCRIANFSIGALLNSTIYSNVTDTIIENSTFGIFFDGRAADISGDNKVKNVQISNSSTGIHFHGSNTKYNTITLTNITNHSYVGLNLTSSSFNNLTQIVVRDKKTSTADGVSLEGSSSILINDSKFIKQDQAIWLPNGYCSLITINNSLISESSYGIDASGASLLVYSQIDNTLINSSTTYGIILTGESASYGGNKINITNSNLSKGSTGIYFYTSGSSGTYGSNIFIKNVRIYNFSSAGVSQSSNYYLGGRTYSDVYIYNNTRGIAGGVSDTYERIHVFDNKIYGILLRRNLSGTTILKDSEIYNNGDGILIGPHYSSSLALIQNTAIFNNTRWGLNGTSNNDQESVDSIGINLRNVTVYNNGEGGLWLRDMCNLSNSVVENNTGPGVYVTVYSTTPGPNISNNQINNNLGGGIKVINPSKNSIRIVNNTLISNSYFGINITYSNNTYIANNTLGLNSIDIDNKSSNISYAYDNACNNPLDFKDFGQVGCTWNYPPPIFISSCSNLTSA